MIKYINSLQIMIKNHINIFINYIYKIYIDWIEYIYFIFDKALFYILKYIYLIFLIFLPTLIIENFVLYFIILFIFPFIFYPFIEKKYYSLIDNFFDKLFKINLLKNKNEYLNKQYEINKDHQKITSKMADISWKLFLHWNRDKILDKSERENLKKEYDELSVQEIKLKRILKEIKNNLLKINILNFLKSKRKYFLLLLSLLAYLINMIIYF